MEFKCKYIISVVILSLCCCSCLCQPVHQLETTTAKAYKERLSENKISRPITSRSGLLGESEDSKDELDNSKHLEKVKAVNLAEKTMREGLQSNNYEEGVEDDLSLEGSCGNASRKLKDTVPMMLIHEMDMLALQIPVRGRDKDDKNNEQKTCGTSDSGKEPFNTRWNPKTSHDAQKMEQKMIADHNANKENYFGMGNRADFDYDIRPKLIEDRGEYGVGSSGDKADLSFGALGRRDLEYLGDKRASVFGNRQAPKYNKYFY